MVMKRMTLREANNFAWSTVLGSKPLSPKVRKEAEQAFFLKMREQTEAMMQNTKELKQFAMSRKEEAVFRKIRGQIETLAKKVRSVAEKPELIRDEKALKRKLHSLNSETAKVIKEIDRSIAMLNKLPDKLPR